MKKYWKILLQMESGYIDPVWIKLVSKGEKFFLKKKAFKKM